MATQPSNLAQKFEAASTWAIALGAIFLVSSVLQLLGQFPGDIGWWNLGISIAVIALGAVTAYKPSAWPLALLCVLFIAIIVDTIFATQYVLNAFGIVPTLIMLARYLILVAAARAMGQALVALLGQRRIEAREERILAEHGDEPSAVASSADEPIPVTRRSETVRLEPATTPRLSFLPLWL